MLDDDDYDTLYKSQFISQFDISSPTHIIHSSSGSQLPKKVVMIVSSLYTVFLILVARLNIFLCSCALGILGCMILFIVVSQTIRFLDINTAQLFFRFGVLG